MYLHVSKQCECDCLGLAVLLSAKTELLFFFPIIHDYFRIRKQIVHYMFFHCFKLQFKSDLLL